MTGPIGVTKNTPSEGLAAEYRVTLAQLVEKERDLLKQLEGGPRSHCLRYEVTMVKEMIRDTRAVLRQLQPNQKKYHASRWCSLDGQSWQWMEKMSWNRLESYEQDNSETLSWMKAVLDDGTAEMTPRQRQVFEMIYREGKKPRQVAKELEVDDTTIYRTARRGIEKLRRYAEARELVRTCVRGDGTIDLRRVVAETAFLTGRQKQVLLLTLNGQSQVQIGQKLEVDKSTVGRTLRRGEGRLKKLTHYLNAQELQEIRNEKIRRESMDWQKSCKELASAYGVSLWVIYKLTAGTRRWEGLTALQYEVWRRTQAGERPGAIADELGMDVKNVYQALSRAKKQKNGEKKNG